MLERLIMQDAGVMRGSGTGPASGWVTLQNLTRADGCAIGTFIAQLIHSHMHWVGGVGARRVTVHGSIVAHRPACGNGKESKLRMLNEAFK